MFGLLKSNIFCLSQTFFVKVKHSR